jgi:hypothetical protein
MLTTHPRLLPRLNMSRSYTSSPPCASMACSRTALLCYYTFPNSCLLVIHDHSWQWNRILEKLIVTQLVKIPPPFTRPEGLLLCLDEPTIGPSPQSHPISLRPISILSSQIILSQRRFTNFNNMTDFLWCEVVRSQPNRETGRPPIVACPRLLIRHIRGYTPYL